MLTSTKEEGFPIASRPSVKFCTSIEIDCGLTEVSRFPYDLSIRNLLVRCLASGTGSDGPFIIPLVGEEGHLDDVGDRISGIHWSTHQWLS